MAPTKAKKSTKAAPTGSGSTGHLSSGLTTAQVDENLDAISQFQNSRHALFGTDANKAECAALQREGVNTSALTPCAALGCDNVGTRSCSKCFSAYYCRCTAGARAPHTARALHVMCRAICLVPHAMYQI